MNNKMQLKKMPLSEIRRILERGEWWDNLCETDVDAPPELWLDELNGAIEAALDELDEYAEAEKRLLALLCHLGERVPESAVCREMRQSEKKDSESMMDKQRLILAMNAGASVLENHRAAESMSFFIRGGEYGKPETTITYLDAAKVLREEAERLTAQGREDDPDETICVDNIKCPYCRKPFDGADATNYDLSCENVKCPHCKADVYIFQSVEYTAHKETS